WWDLTTGRKLRQYPDPAPSAPDPSEFSSAIAVADRGTRVAIGRGSSIVVRELATGREVRRIDGLPGAVFTLVFSPDQHMLAWIDGTITPSWASTIRLVEVATGKQRQQLAAHLGPI